MEILLHLYHTPNVKKGFGTGTIGSSEAILLALIAHKVR